MSQATEARWTDALPTALAELVAEFVAASPVDFTDADAVRGECETYSLALARHLDGREAEDDMGDPAPVEAWTAQKWLDRVPARLEDNELAGGHYYTRVRFDGEEYEVDLTAAQFPEMGWTGPRAR